MPRLKYSQLLDENIRLRQHIDFLERRTPVPAAVVARVDEDLRGECREEERDLFEDNADD